MPPPEMRSPVLAGEHKHWANSSKHRRCAGEWCGPMGVQTRRARKRPHPHHDCDKPDKRCRRHLREIPVYSIKIKRAQLFLL
jgi:hypothetical protein